MSSTQIWLRRTSLVFLILIPLIALLAFALPLIYWLGGVYNVGDNTLVLSPTPPRKGAELLGLAVGLPATLAWLYALYRLKKVFSRFRQGLFIDNRAAFDLRAYSLFAMLAVAFDVATSGARRWAQGEHDAPFWTHININTEHMSLIFTAGVFLVVSFVLIEAERYKTETEQYL
jgi:hypothetical protein